MGKKPFKETKLGKFLSDKVPGVLDVVDDYFPPAKVLTALVGKNLPPEDQIEFDKLVQEHEKEMYALEIHDRDSARSREVETIKAGRKFDILMLVTGFIILGLSILTVVAIFFLDLKNKELSHFIAGEIIGMSLGTMVSYYFGSSKSSADKNDVMKVLTR